MWNFNSIYEEYAEIAAPFFFESEAEDEREVLGSLDICAMETVA